jgi:hypothetical protein
MLVSCWSAKGGSGTTVIAAALASVLSHRSDEGSLLVDAAGDLPLLLGLPEPEGPGLTEWVAAGPDVPADALARLEVAVRPGVRLLPRGTRALGDPARVEVLAAVLAGDPRPVVVDVGLVSGRPADGPSADAALALAAGATHSLLVTRSCFLSVERARRLPLTPSGIVLVTEPGRAMDRHEVEARLGAPVVGEVAVEGQIARAVDNGTLGRRVPRALERGLRHAA